MSPCPRLTHASIPSAVYWTPSASAISVVRDVACAVERGAKRKRVQRDCSAGMILLP